MVKSQASDAAMSEVSSKNSLRSRRKSPKTPVDGGDGQAAEVTPPIDTHLDLIVEGLLNAEDPLDHFEDLKIIGHGGTAEVFKATRKSDGSIVALKKFREDSPLGDIANELRTLRLCAHKHINGYVEGFIWENRVFLCLVYCVGSLTDILHIFKAPFQEREIAAVAQHCLEALHYIHTKCSTVHRDIKANNILLSADGKAMVGDFGISKVLEGDQKASTFIGSPYWMAPEVILAMETGTYSYSVDVWSLGITLVELAETKPPLFDLHAMSACYHIANNDPPKLTKPSEWSPAFVDFLSHCLVLSPEDRWTTKQLMEHEFLNLCGGGPESKNILKDLLRRSRLKRAEVNGIDVSALTNTGLVNNAPPQTSLDRIAEPDEGGAEEGDADTKRTMSAPSKSASKQSQVGDVAGGVRSASEHTARADLPPLRGTGLAPPKTLPKVADTIAERQANLFSGGVNRPREAGSSKEASPRPDDTIKMPNLLAAEEAHALGRESINLKSQMKEISKLRAKHTEELRKMTDRNTTEVQGMVKVQENVARTLKRTHEAALREHTKETASGLGKLHKTRIAAVKKVEDELKKAWSAARKEDKSALKQELKTLKKDQKKELSKSGLEEMLEVYRARRTKEFNDNERRCYTLELAALQCTSEIQEAEYKIERVRSEFEVRDSLLKVWSELLWEHRTGPVCLVQRAHLRQLHDSRVEMQRERHDTIEKQLLTEHTTGVELLQRRQRTISKKMSYTLKKVTPMDEEVLRKYASHQRSNSDGGLSASREEINIDDLVSQKSPTKSRASKKMSSLSKEARKGLKAAREEHIRERTLKLNDDHLRILDLKMKIQAQHLAELQRQHTLESNMLLETLEKEVAVFDRKLQKIRTSTEQYSKMEKQNLSATKKEGMKKPFKKNAESIAVQRRLLDSTLDDLRVLYKSMRGKAGTRPPALNDISVTLQSR